MTENQYEIGKYYKLRTFEGCYAVILLSIEDAIAWIQMPDGDKITVNLEELE